MVKKLELTTKEQSFLASMMSSESMRSNGNLAKIEEYNVKYGCDPCDACGPASCADCKACATEPISLPSRKY